MTLVINEIHLVDGLNRSIIISAADRKITNVEKRISRQRKLFEIPYIKGGSISFFGLAEVYPQRKMEFMSSWLPNFIKSHSDLKNLQDFSECLRNTMNEVVPSSILVKNASGFHVSGFTDEGYPDFWHFSNIGKLENYKYSDLLPAYNPAHSEYLAGNARRDLHWDGINPSSIQNLSISYRNGDYRAHVMAFEKIDEIFRKGIELSILKPITQYEEYIRFKFEMIADLYQKWGTSKGIGKPIDVLIYKSWEMA